MGKKCKGIVMLYLSLLSPTLSSPCGQVPIIFIGMSLVLPFPNAKSFSSKHWADVRCFVKMGELLCQFRSKDFTYRVHGYICTYLHGILRPGVRMAHNHIPVSAAS